MKKLLLLSMVAAGLYLSGCSYYQKKKAEADSVTMADSDRAMLTNAPAFQFEHPMHDFGKIQQGDKVTYQFKFTNTGKSPLIIENAVATCGCTTPVWPTAPVKPGDTSHIQVTFNSLGKMGLQDKMITITANTVPRQTMVHLVGEVIAKK
jgi:hypothetical protein